MFLIDDFLKPIVDSINQIDEIKGDIPSIEKGYQNKAVFVFSFSLFESCLLDLLRVYYDANPREIPKKNLQEMDMEFVLNTTFSHEVVGLIAANYIRALSYENLIQIIKHVCSILNIEFESLKFNRKRVNEIKARRNAFVHNNGRIDKDYIKSASVDPRMLNSKLGIDLNYFLETLGIFEEILLCFKSGVLAKYSSHTKVNFIKETWEYYFSILPFDKYCFFQDSNFRFRSHKDLKKAKNNLSSSERSLLAYFCQNYSPAMCDIIFEFEDLNMQVSTSKMKDMVELFKKYPLLLQDEGRI